MFAWPSYFENLRVKQDDPRKHPVEIGELFLFSCDFVDRHGADQKKPLFGLSLRQGHAADRVFADAPKVEHALVLDHIGNLREALR